MSSADSNADAQSAHWTPPTLPAFVSVANGSRSSIANSSGASKSIPSSTHSLQNEHTDILPRSSNDSAEHEASSREWDGSLRRHSRKRSSGGFLLDDAGLLKSRSSRLLSQSLRGRRSGKGKRKSQEPELLVAKRRAPGVRESHRLSLGSSPLATEVRQNGDADQEGDQGRPATLPQSRHSLSSRKSGSPGPTTQTAAGARHHYEPIRSIPADTNPAQIVNLALSLSEARRRQASGMQTASNIIGKQRTPSRQLARSSFQEYSTPQRQLSRTLSSRPEAETHGSREQQPMRDEEEVEVISEDDGSSMLISPATLKRVEKAKNFFELAYEHRRLLPHLPPLRNPGSQARPAGPEGQSRAYNPLQYVRNRKLRFRQRAPIQSERGGWHDIQQVKDWVDAVVATHVEIRHDPDECIRLPDLSQWSSPEMQEDKDNMILDSPRQGSSKPSLRRDGALLRPRSDWEFHPGDMIADAYWLEQGINKTLIEDRDGNRIYPPGIHFKFSGWRNRVPLEVPTALQEPTPPPELPNQEADADGQHLRTAVPELPTFKPTHHEKKLRKGRSRRSKGKRDTVLFPLADDNSGPAGFHGDSESSSTASDSDDDLSRGRQRGSPHSPIRANTPNDPSDLRRLHTATTASDSLGPPSFTQEQTRTQSASSSSKRGSLDGGRIQKLLTRDSKTRTPLYYSKTPSESTRRGSAQPRLSQDSEGGPRSSAEYDTTAGSSPTVPEFPSIAINLSPPHSRSPSPTKKSLSARLNPFRDRSKQRDGVDVSDFGQPGSPKASRQASTESEGANHGSTHGSRGTSPMTRGRVLRPAETDAHPHNEEQRGSIASRSSNKSALASTENAGRIRGIFKGGRIAEIVGNEVSRVGDFILKREPPTTQHRRMTASTSSLPSHLGSDSDREELANGVVLKTPQRQRRHSPSRPSGHVDRVSPLSSSSPISTEGLHYNNPNLPVFVSPFQRDREIQEEKKRALLSPMASPSEHDHISRAAAEHRSASRSSRFERLALPRLDTSRPSTPSGLTHQESYGFGSPLDLSKSRGASQIFNEAISGDSSGLIATGLANLEPTQSLASLARGLDAPRQSLVDGKLGRVTGQDIARAYALVFTSVVKAREIARRADEIRDPVPQFILNTLGTSTDALHSSSPLRIRRREEHVFAARNLMDTLSAQVDMFQDRLQGFERKTVPALRAQLQMMEDMVEKTLTPRVQAAADGAGELSMKLATTSTLAVKDVNDQIGHAIRLRRRGPVRWLRLFGYKMIELGVVGLLWVIWFVVTFVRVVVKVCSGICWAVLWLFWLD